MTVAIAPSPVLAAGAWRTNGELIDDCRRLGYLHPDWLTLDPTYGEGLFWSVFRPRRLVAGDLDPAKSPWPAGPLDAAALPWWWTRRFGAVVIDPPYKLNGTDQGEGARYGVAGHYSSVERRHSLMYAMLRDGRRVLAPGGFLLFKCQDQTNGGRKHWQSRMFAEYGEQLGLVHVDTLLFPGYRPQPARSTCLRCRSKIMRRSDGRWGNVRRAPGNVPMRCTSTRLTATPRGWGWSPLHENDPDDIGQDASHVNYSTLLVFQRPEAA